MAGQLGHIAATAELNVNPFIQSTKVLERSIKTTSQAMRAQEVAYKNSGNSLNSLTASHKMAGRQLNQYDALLKKQNAEYTVMKNKIGDVNNATDKEKQMLANKATQINKTTAQMEGLRGKYSSMSKTIATQNSLWTKSGNVISSAGEKMTKASGSMRTFSTVGAVGLGVAVNSALKFDNEIKSMGALLGTTGSTLKNQLAGISEASKKWSVEYGVSTSAINEGMSELIKKGYTYNQAMGAMPSILNAATASNEDFNDVMTVSTSILEQFGLKANDSATMLKNTQRVTDSLTFVANETSTSFGGLGAAMEYVGPVANGLGMSVEETSAALGEMSQQGIDGEKAGTSLRGALSQLLNPSAQNEVAFKKLGVSVKDFKNGTLDLPGILDKINTNTKGMTKQQKSATVAMAFGTQAQTGMNAMLSQGGEKLRELTKETKNAKGYTKSLAETMNNTAQANVKKFKESLNVLGIEVGAKLIPKLKPLISNLSDAVTWFSKLDDNTLSTIVTVGALTVALGPALGVLGKLASGVGLVHTAFGKLSGVLNSTKLATTATEFKGVEGAAAGVGSKVGLLPGLFTPAGLAIAGVTVVAVAGVAAWELWGKKAVESSQKTGRWGTDVSDATDKSLTKMSEFTTKTSAGLDLVSNGSKTAAGHLGKNFHDAFEQMKTDSGKTIEKMKQDVASLDENDKTEAKKRIDQKKSENERILSENDKTSKKVQSILTNASKEKRNLTNDENIYIKSAQQKMASDELDILGISTSKQKKIRQALTGDISKMNNDQLSVASKALEDGYQKEADFVNKKTAVYKKSYEDGTISKKTYNAKMKELNSQQTNTSETYAARNVEILRKMGFSEVDIAKSIKAEYGVSLESVNKKTEEMAKAARKSGSDMIAITANMSTKSRSAADAWNNLVFDSKTGKVTTNMDKVIGDSIKTKAGWDNLLFITKDANLSSNAKLKVAEATIAAGKWNELPIKTQKLLATNKDVLAKLVEAGISIDGYDTKVTPDIKKLKGDNGQIIGVVNTATGKITTYDKKKPSEKILKANGVDVDNKTKNATGKVDWFNNFPLITKKLNASDNTSGKAKTAGSNLSNFNRNNPRGKSLKASDNASYNANKATGSVSAFQRKRDHTVTLTTKHTSIFTTISNYIKKHFERGTNSAPGGSAMVNDASGSNYQEMIQLPNGQRIMPQGRNVTMGIPKGSRVFTATQTKNMLRNVENSGAGSTLRQFNDVRQKETTATANIDLSGLNNQIEKLTKIMKQGMSNQKDGDVVINMNANIDGEQDIKQISKSLGFAIQRERRGSM